MKGFALLLLLALTASLGLTNADGDGLRAPGTNPLETVVADLFSGPTAAGSTVLVSLAGFSPLTVFTLAAPVQTP